MSHYRAFEVPQRNVDSGERTNNLRAKTIYDNVVNLAENGGVWHKKDGSTFTGNVYIGRDGRGKNSCLIGAKSHKDLLDVTKGKYLQCPPKTVLDLNQQGIYYGPYTITNVDLSGQHVIEASANGLSNQFDYEGQYGPDASANAVKTMVVDPSFNVFYREGSYLLGGTCNKGLSLSYKQHVDISVNYSEHDGSGSLLPGIKQIERTNLFEGFSYPGAFDFSCCYQT